MRARMRVVSLVAVVAGLVSCGGGSGSSGGSGTANGTRAPTSSATTASPDQLRARLLTAGDVGGYWRTGEPINAEDLKAFAQLPCEKTLDPAVAKRLTAVAGAQFSPANRSYQHLIELVATGAPSQLGSDLQTLFAAIGSCSGGSAAARLTVRTFGLPALGDQQRGFLVSQKSSGSAATSLSLRFSFVRVGSWAVAVGLADFQATAPAAAHISDAAYVALLQKAVTKLKG